MKKPVLLFWLAALGALTTSAQTIDATLSKALDSLAPKTGTMTVSVGNFTYADKGLGSSFSLYLQEKLSVLASANPKWSVFARDKLAQIQDALSLSLTGMFDEATVPQIGMLKAIQGIITGRFLEEGTGVRVFIELVSAEKGTLLGKTDILFPKAELPPQTVILPDNYNDALFVLKELSEVQASSDKDFIVKAWTDRGNGGTYRDAEEMVINFFASRDCFIKVYHVDVKGSTKLIFPNEFYADNKIKAKQIYRIPDSSYPFSFAMTAPYGAEFVKVIASTLQFKEIEQSFEDMGPATKGLVVRGLDVKAKNLQTAETLISYTVVK